MPQTNPMGVMFTSLIPKYFAISLPKSLTCLFLLRLLIHESNKTNKTKKHPYLPPPDKEGLGSATSKFEQTSATLAIC